VREVALAHLRALQVPEARNKRFLLSYKVRDRELIYCTVKLASIFDP
jgi:hypothetical protein